MLQAARGRCRVPRLWLEPLEERLAPVIRTWSGGGINANWSTAANWGATGVPSTGDDLQFPATAFTTSTNDLNNIFLNSITFSAAGYTLSGLPAFVASTIAMTGAGTNRLTLEVRLPSDYSPTVDVDTGGTVDISGVVSGFGPLVKTGSGELILGGNNTFTGGLHLSEGILTVASNTAAGTGFFRIDGGTTLRADSSPRTLANTYTLGGPATITFAGSSDLTLTGNGGVAEFVALTFDVTNTGLTTLAGNISSIYSISPITKNGAGTLVLGGTNDYGATTVNAGTFLVNGSQSGYGVTVNTSATLGGTGITGAITSVGGTVSPGVSPGTLRAAAVTFDAASTFRVELNGTTPGSGHDQLDASAAVSLGGSTLTATLGFPSTVGDAFVILRSAVGVTGNFAGLSDGTVFTVTGKAFRINYSTTAVTLTRVQVATTTALTVTPSPSTFGQTITLTATITSTLAGTIPATGTVNFRDGGTLISTATATGGVATLTTAGLTVGVHSLTAEYIGDDTYTGSTSSAVSHTVNQVATTIALTVAPGASVFGQALTFTATVTSAAAGIGPPTGTVTFLDGTTTLGTATLAGGSATFSTSTLAVGAHTLTAVYGGDTIFSGSSSAAVSRTVDRAGTTTVVTSSANPAGINLPVTFTVTVSALAPGAGTPTGTVQLFVFLGATGTGTLGTATLSGGQAQFTVTTLPPGCLGILASYQGDGNFSPSTSSATFQQSIAASPNQAFMLAVYRDVLERAPDRSGFDFWVSQLDAGVSRATVATAFWLSPEHRGVQVDTFYRLLLQREADPTGRAQWVNALLAGVSEVEIVATFVSSAEYTATHPTAESFVNGLYQDVLGRAADSAGAATWTQIVASGARNRAAVAYYFLTSEEAYLKALDDYYRHFLGRPADPAGLAGLLTVLEDGSNPAAIAAVFLSSPEYFQRAQIATC